MLSLGTDGPRHHDPGQERPGAGRNVPRRHGRDMPPAMTKRTDGGTPAPIAPRRTRVSIDAECQQGRAAQRHPPTRQDTDADQ